MSPWSPCVFSNLHVCSCPFALSPSSFLVAFTTCTHLLQPWKTRFCTNFVEFPSSTLIIFSFVKCLLFNQSPWLLHEFGLLGLKFWHLMNTFNLYIGFKKIYCVWKNHMFRSSFLGEDFCWCGFLWMFISLHRFFPPKKVYDKGSNLDLCLMLKIYSFCGFFLFSSSF